MSDPSENAGYKWQVYAPRGGVDGGGVSIKSEGLARPSGFTSCAVTNNRTRMCGGCDRAGRNAEGMPPRGERQTQTDNGAWISLSLWFHTVDALQMERAGRSAVVARAIIRAINNKIKDI